MDLLGLLAEEAASVDAAVSGGGRLRGDPRLLRRLVRNLLDNARRHSAGASVEASVRARKGGGAVLRSMAAPGLRRRTGSG